MKRTLATILALALVPFLAPLAGAQYATDFEAFNASTAGVPVAGQDGFYNPVPASSVDFLAYPYAGNPLTIPVNPKGGKQFIACVGPAGSPVFYGRSERLMAWCGAKWTMGFDILANFTGTGTATDNLGSVSTQPSATNEGFIALVRWSTPGTHWKVSYQVYDAANVSSYQDVADPNFVNLPVNQWYRWETDFDFSTHLITEVRLTDLATMTTWKNQPVGWYLRGGSAGAARPTGFRFFAGSGVAGNLLAYDNVNLTMHAAGTKALATIFGSGKGRPNPMGSLLPQGLPLLASPFAVGIQNPLFNQAKGSATLLFLSDGKADPGFLVPGTGMGGGAGELLLNPKTFIFGIAGPAWDGQNPALVPLTLPPNCALLGALLHVQGLIADPTPLAKIPLGLTEGMDMLIGNVK